MQVATVTDDQGATDTSQIQITVVGTNDAPVAGADISAKVAEGDSAIGGQLTSTDSDEGATATFSVSEGAEAPAGFLARSWSVETSLALVGRFWSEAFGARDV